MNTIAITASTNTILAIDLGKYKSVACVYDQAMGEMSFTTCETTQSELGKLLDKHRPAVVIIEACLLAGWVHDLCGELGVRCLVANTASGSLEVQAPQRKTDRCGTSSKTCDWTLSGAIQLERCVRAGFTLHRSSSGPGTTTSVPRDGRRLGPVRSWDREEKRGGT
jgi:hypothetical protein